ncbi:methyltransferase domain-containing protein [Phyllobacterium phragmitis]|uniref:Methyltransferase domain-containing protein n=1 Tax=Phyllobacterium phragmitis TaxID=2670329 RepID=A0ABQ0H1H6_9HYPH
MTAFVQQTDEQWFNTLIGRDRAPIFGLPDARTQRGTVGKDGEDALNDALMFWQFIRRIAAAEGKTITSSSKILDFGVSWARILRFFLRDTPAQNLYGVDVEDRFLEHARRDVPSVNYSLISPEPPLPFESNKFDIIYAFSVFSHLPQRIADGWVTEFARVLKPDGIACLTTRPRAHLRTKTELYAKAIGNPAEAEARYDRGEFVFYPLHGGGDLAESHYGEAIIPRAYVEKEWSRHLTVRGFYENYSPSYLQPCFVLKKRAT